MIAVITARAPLTHNLQAVFKEPVALSRSSQQFTELWTRRRGEETQNFDYAWPVVGPVSFGSEFSLYSNTKSLFDI